MVIRRDGRIYLDAQEAAVYLASTWNRPVSPAYARVLAHRHGWRRIPYGRRVVYLANDVAATGDTPPTS
jgi:hypothetical protein